MTQTQWRVVDSVLVNFMHTRTIMIVVIVRNIIDIGELLLSHSPKSNFAIICRERYLAVVWTAIHTHTQDTVTQTQKRHRHEHS